MPTRAWTVTSMEGQEIMIGIAQRDASGNTPDGNRRAIAATA
jgi:uncharacterized protein YjcR